MISRGGTNVQKAVYKPGTRCAYTSGTGYDVLGQILVATDPKKRSSMYFYLQKPLQEEVRMESNYYQMNFLKKFARTQPEICF